MLCGPPSMNNMGTESPHFPPRLVRSSLSVHAWVVGEQGALVLTNADFQREKWCCQTGLNCRPLHYQWSALPLSYGSVPRIKRIGPKGPTRRADPCHKAPSGASARLTRYDTKMSRHQRARYPRPLHQAQLRANPVPHFLSLPSAAPESAIARRASETQYVPTIADPAGRGRLMRQSDASHPASVAKAPARIFRPSVISRSYEQVHDEG
jgi:hypothetical protein